MNKQKLLLIQAHLSKALSVPWSQSSTPEEFLVVQSVQAALGLVQDELLALGWTNSPADVPEMRAASQQAESYLAEINR